ncbi:MAG: 50S ribosomal protein L3 [Patescibacteria group bacterium]
MKYILGRKVGMTRVFDDEGRHVAVTIVKPMFCKVSAVKKGEKDGYKSVQISAYKNISGKKVAKISEFREDNIRVKVGDEVKINQFLKDELVTVSGISKGKGFAGTIKRHSFHSGPKSHGSNNVREPGSIGGGYPQRVVLGRKMPGKMGAEMVTVKNLKIVDIDNENILIAGAVPGPSKGILKIYGKGEKAEEEVDTAALEEKAAMEKMLEDQKAEKEEGGKDKSEAEKIEERTEGEIADKEVKPEVENSEEVKSE